jgi:hypothetical protein
MIKLTDLIKELEEIEVRPAMAQMPSDDDEFIKQGFRTTPTEIDPETGTITSKVEYIPSFEKVRRDLLKSRKEFQPFKDHSNESIAKNAKDLNTLLTKAANLVFALEKMVELERKK